ncbi:MAG: DUF1572 family protein [Bacteroidota bacterium]|nr:DUF1572 family protein [Bacteroidota bacterium]
MTPRIPTPESHIPYSIISVFKQYKALAEKAIAQLDEKELFYLPDPESNSIAIIMRHLAGNMISRWTDFLTTDGEKPDRNRDAEFEQDDLTEGKLILYWEQGWKVFLDTLHSLQPDDLQKTIYIRKEPYTVMEAIARQLAHYSYHIGQIVFIAKHLKNTDWKTLSIAKGKSQDFNNELMGK